MTPVLFPTVPPVRIRHEVKLAPVRGMGAELRAALTLLESRLARGPLTILGPLGPNARLREKFRVLGLRETDPEGLHAGTRTVVVPPGGVPRSLRDRWRQAGYELLDLTLPAVRRAATSLGLLAMEGCRPVVAGTPGEAETLTLAADLRGAAVAGDADEAARLAFSPKFGVVAQPGFSPRRARLIAEALRQRHRDAAITFLETTAIAMLERERSLETLSRWADLVVVAGGTQDASVRALLEAARRLGLAGANATAPEELELGKLRDFRRIVVTAGEFTPDEAIAAIAAALMEAV